MVTCVVRGQKGRMEVGGDLCCQGTEGKGGGRW